MAFIKIVIVIKMIMAIIKIITVFINLVSLDLIFEAVEINSVIIFVVIIIVVG